MAAELRMEGRAELEYVCAVYKGSQRVHLLGRQRPLLKGTWVVAEDYEKICE